MKNTLTTTALLFLGLAHAQHLKVSRSAWDGLQPGEREAIQAGQVVEVYENETYGLVMDAQRADRSDPGTNAGAVLGSMGAQAAYIDRALGGHGYSALAQLGVGLLGGFAGSALDRPPERRYQHRYALRMADGEIRYADVSSPDPFRHPPGVCLSLPALRPIGQSVCAHGSDDLRKRFLRAPDMAPALPIASPNAELPGAPYAASGGPDHGLCRLGSLAPVPTTADKCSAIGGSFQ